MNENAFSVGRVKYKAVPEADGCDGCVCSIKQLVQRVLGFFHLAMPNEGGMGRL